VYLSHVCVQQSEKSFAGYVDAGRHARTHMGVPLTSRDVIQSAHVQKCASQIIDFVRKAACLFDANYNACKIHAIVALREVFHVCVITINGNLYPNS